MDDSEPLADDSERFPLSDEDWLPIPDGMWRHIPWSLAPTELRRYVSFTSIHPDGIHLVPWRRIPPDYRPPWLEHYENSQGWTTTRELEEAERTRRAAHGGDSRSVDSREAISVRPFGDRRDARDEPCIDSAHLTRNGFSFWFPFNVRHAAAWISRAPSAPATYAIRCRDRMPLRRGNSDIVYVGSAAGRHGLQMRLRHYFNPGPTQFTNQRLLARCGASDAYELGFHSLDSGLAAQQLERLVLQEFVRIHGELPAENRRLPEALGARATPSAVDVAEKMFKSLEAAPMGRNTRTRLEAMRDSGDCEGIVAVVEGCVRRQPVVNRSILRAGQHSFESALPELRQLLKDFRSASEE